MLRGMNDFKSYNLEATDGSIGDIKDFYFDDATWVVRYFVVEAGSWLFSRKVLISPMAIDKPNWAGKTLPLLISKDQVKNSPAIDTDKPVSRQHEIDYLSFYGYPFYWEGAHLWGGSITPYTVNPQNVEYMPDQVTSFKANKVYEDLERQRHENVDPNLRSCEAIIGYSIHGNDGEVGHVSELLVDEETWAIRYFVVKTGNWLGGHKLLISTDWIDELRWMDNSVSVSVSKQAIKDAPAFESTEKLNRELEEALYEHYGLTGYWARKPKSNITSKNYPKNPLF